MEELTSGQYVMVVNTGYGPGVYENGWITAQAIDAGSDTVTGSVLPWTITVDGDTVKLTDSNGVLADFNFSSSDSSVSITKSGNTLTISSAEALDGSVRITAIRNNIPVVSESAKLIAYGDDSLQDVVTGVENAEPVSAYLNIDTPTGNVELKKTSEDGVVAGIRFTIEGNGIRQTVTTDEKGLLC